MENIRKRNLQCCAGKIYKIFLAQHIDFYRVYMMLIDVENKSTLKKKYSDMS